MDEEKDRVAKQISQLEEVHLDLSVVMDKVATWPSIRSGVESAPGGCMTSDFEARYVFRRQYDFGVVVEGYRWT